jgi:hypothetical protein
MVTGGAVQAASITSWNTGNVDVGETPALGETGFSVVYDRAFPDAAAVALLRNSRLRRDCPLPH